MESFKTLALAASISSIALLAGCSNGSPSSGSSGSTTTGSTQTETEKGVFVDSPVAGINYVTAPGGQQGQTNEVGEYDYTPGDTVTFSIGGIELPAVEATGRITPADMGSGATDWSTDSTVINILRLLQTLDEDGNPDNGITITAAIHTALQDIAIDPTLSEADFETQANSALGKTLIDKIVAIEHFKSSQAGDLTGSWVYEEDNGNINVLTFFNGDEYLIVHSQDDGDEQTAGSGEYGTYTWDSATGELTLVVDPGGNTDGSGGLAGNDASTTWTMQLIDGALALSMDDERIVFEAVRNDRDSLVGSWYLGEGSFDGKDFNNVLTILDDSTYVVAHSANEEAYGENPVVGVSSEWGSYSFTGSNFAVSNVTVDLDGPGGLFDNPTIDNGDGPVDGPATLHPTGELTLTDNADSSETFTLQRLGRYVVELMDFEGDTKSMYVEADLFTGGAPEQEVSFQFADLTEEGEQGTFDLQFSDTQNITVDLTTQTDDSRTGTMTFDGSGEANTVSWEISTSGALALTETDGSEGDYGHWRFQDIVQGEDIRTLVYLDGVGSLELLFITDLDLPQAPQ